MNRDEFLAYAAEVLAHENLECLFDSIAEHNSECAMFGDSGPGTGYRIDTEIARLRKIDAQYQRMTGCGSHLPASFGVRSPR